MTDIHPDVQKMIDNGVFSYTPVDGWVYGFIDGKGWGASGWMPPLPEPEFPKQTERRNRRVSLNTTISDIAKRLGVSTASVSQFEFGRIQWDEGLIDTYDDILDQIEEEQKVPSLFLYQVKNQSGKELDITGHSFINAAHKFSLAVGIGKVDLLVGMIMADPLFCRSFIVNQSGKQIDTYTVQLLRSVT